MHTNFFCTDRFNNQGSVSNPLVLNEIEENSNFDGRTAFRKLLEPSIGFQFKGFLK